MMLSRLIAHPWLWLQRTVAFIHVRSVSHRGDDAELGEVVALDHLALEVDRHAVVARAFLLVRVFDVDLLIVFAAG